MTNLNCSPALRIGVLGLGRAFTLMLETFQNDARVQLVGAYDISERACAQFEAEFGLPSSESEQALCERPDIDVIYIATPHQLHVKHTLMAAAYGKHVLVEKPLAINVEDCQSMIAACKHANVCLMVGHSHSFDTPIKAARSLIQRGDFGALRMIHSLNYTDFLYRPRTGNELSTAHGGGVLFSQASHQVDVARMLADGKVIQVVAHTGIWDPRRATEGAYSALLLFETGAFANLTYSGYAHFDSDTWMDDLTELGVARQPNKHSQTRTNLHIGTTHQTEEQLKYGRTFGATGWQRLKLESPLAHQHFGPLIISCERADIRPTPRGLWIDSDSGSSFQPLADPTIARQEVIDELVAATTDSGELRHSGEWALANLEICLCILNAGATGEAQQPRYQTRFHHD